MEKIIFLKKNSIKWFEETYIGSQFNIINQAKFFQTLEEKSSCNIRICKEVKKFETQDIESTEFNKFG
jgi:hypothetical protein